MPSLRDATKNWDPIYFNIAVDRAQSLHKPAENIDEIQAQLRELRKERHAKMIANIIAAGARTQTEAESKAKDIHIEDQDTLIKELHAMVRKLQPPPWWKRALMQGVIIIISAFVGAAVSHYSQPDKNPVASNQTPVDSEPVRRLSATIANAQSNVSKLLATETDPAKRKLLKDLSADLSVPAHQGGISTP